MRNLLIFVGIAIVAIIAVVFMINRSGNEISSESPTPSPAVPTSNDNISVTSPAPFSIVNNPISVTGQARVFENTFSYALRDSQGNKLYENFAMADAPDIGQFGSFEVKIPVPSNASSNLTIEVFNYSARDGSVENLISIPVILATTETMSVQLYFGKRGVAECEKTLPVERRIIRTVETAFISISELLKGPTQTDKDQGFLTSIPENVKINSIRIENGTAYVDFDATLDYQIGGSCRVSAIRSQITNTLKQFSSVNDVVISVNGRTEDILQP